MNLNVDGDGFLKDRSDWNADVMLELAEHSNIEITPEVLEYVEKVRAWYDEEGVVPPIRTFSKATGGDRKGTYLNKLFHGAPMKKLAKIAGMPKPTGCV